MNRVILVGFMGAGKSFIGKKLAALAGVPFLDSDESIAREQGMSIPELFKTKGEEAFRNHEATLIDHLDTSASFVLSVGGGLPCHHNLMDKLNQIGETVYLRCGVDLLLKRLITESAERPLISGMNGTELKRYILEKLQEREPEYLKARYVLSENQHSNMDIDFLIDLLRKN